MKILIVSQYFWPENFRINDFIPELIKRGHTVSVLTGIPNYPAGKIFSEYKDQPSKFLSYKEAEIFRVPIITRGSGSIRLFINYISFIIYRMRKTNEKN